MNNFNEPVMNNFKDSKLHSDC